MVSLVVYDLPEVARATSRLTSDTLSSLAGADRAALVLAVAKDDDLRSFERRERTAKRASEAKNRDRTRYMGSQDASASCLVSAHDRIMGTHRRGRPKISVLRPFPVPPTTPGTHRNAEERKGTHAQTLLRRQCISLVFDLEMLTQMAAHPLDGLTDEW